MKISIPYPNSKRWTQSRKSEVLSAIIAGEISVDEVCRRYETSPQELGEWWRATQRPDVASMLHGVAGASQKP